MRRLASLVLLCPLAAWLAACEGGGPLAPDAQGPSGLMARVELVTTRAPDGSGETTAEARFVRYQGIDAPTAATLSGLAAEESVAPGSCELLDPTASADAAMARQGGAGYAGVDLAFLAAGSLSFRIGGATTVALDPQRAPDLLPFLSGVEYGGQSAAPADALDGDEVTFAASGAQAADPDGLGPFGATATMPSEVQKLAVNGLDPSAGPVTIAAGAALDVRWQPDPAATPADAVLVELRAAAGADAALVCRPTGDDGELQVPADALSEVPGRTAGTAYLAVLRTRTLPLALPGVASDDSVLVLGSREGTALQVTP